MGSWVEKAKAGSPHLSKKRLAIGLAWPSASVGAWPVS